MWDVTGASHRSHSPASRVDHGGTERQRADTTLQRDRPRKGHGPAFARGPSSTGTVVTSRQRPRTTPTKVQQCRGRSCGRVERVEDPEPADAPSSRRHQGEEDEQAHDPFHAEVPLREAARMVARKMTITARRCEETRSFPLGPSGRRWDLLLNRRAERRVLKADEACAPRRGADGFYWS